MPIYRLLTNETAFTPEDITAIEGVFEAALRELGLVSRSDPLAEMVAKKIIELAKRGELRLSQPRAFAAFEIRRESTGEAA